MDPDYALKDSPGEAAAAAAAATLPRVAHRLPRHDAARNVEILVHSGTEVLVYLYIPDQRVELFKRSAPRLDDSKQLILNLLGIALTSMNSEGAKRLLQLFCGNFCCRFLLCRLRRGRGAGFRSWVRSNAEERGDRRPSPVTCPMTLNGSRSR